MLQQEGVPGAAEFAVPLMEAAELSPRMAALLLVPGWAQRLLRVLQDMPATRVSEWWRWQSLSDCGK